jgi:hypothetical protein
MGEVVQVAKAKGLNVPEGTIDKLIEQCTSVKEGLPSSMLFDYLAGRPMEVEVSRHGRACRCVVVRRLRSLLVGWTPLHHALGNPRDTFERGYAIGSRVAFVDSVCPRSSFPAFIKLVPLYAN